MNNKTKIIIAVFALMLAAGVSGIFAQTTATATITVNDVALFDVNTAVPVTFTVDDPANAGELPLITPAGGPTYLQYTVIVAATETKKVTASCDKAMRAGLRLDVWSGAPTGTGGVGTALAGGLSVSEGYTATTAVDIINGITSCATGSGTTQGPAVYYTLTFDETSFSDLVTGAADVYTVTYTLTDG